MYEMRCPSPTTSCACGSSRDGERAQVMGRAFVPPLCGNVSGGASVYLLFCGMLHMALQPVHAVPRRHVRAWLQEWQRQALEAVSVWLVEDTQRIEPKLLVKRHTGIIVAMFQDASKSQERLLKPFKDMLTCSPKLCTFFSAQVRWTCPQGHAGRAHVGTPEPSCSSSAAALRVHVWLAGRSA